MHKPRPVATVNWHYGIEQGDLHNYIVNVFVSPVVHRQCRAWNGRIVGYAHDFVAPAVSLARFFRTDQLKIRLIDTSHVTI